MLRSGMLFRFAARRAFLDRLANERHDQLARPEALDCWPDSRTKTTTAPSRHTSCRLVRKTPAATSSLTGWGPPHPADDRTGRRRLRPFLRQLRRLHHHIDASGSGSTGAACEFFGKQSILMEIINRLANERHDQLAVRRVRKEIHRLSVRRPERRARVHVRLRAAQHNRVVDQAPALHRVVEAHLMAVRIAAHEQNPLDRWLLPERRADARLQACPRWVHDRHDPADASRQLREQLVDLALGVAALKLRGVLEAVQACVLHAQAMCPN